MQTLTPQHLFDLLAKHFDIHWVAGKHFAHRAIRRNLYLGEHTTLIGHLNLIHPNRIQVIGRTEWNYLEHLRKNTRTDTLREIFSRRTVALIFSDGLIPTDEFVQLADVQKTPLFCSILPSNDLIDSIRFYLSNLLADKITLHGVYMEVMGHGVLITGDSSAGKSELALELISRGHRLIADDAPVFTRVGPGLLNGTCPDMLKDFMEVRGLGILNIRAMYGDNAIKQNKLLRMIIRLAHLSAEALQNLDRLHGSRSTRQILNVDIPEIILPVASGRNLAVMVEAAVRNHILIEHGHNSSEEFVRRQQQYIERNS
jgi:HPr kinase/phosphorylase